MLMIGDQKLERPYHLLPCPLTPLPRAAKQRGGGNKTLLFRLQSLSTCNWTFDLKSLLSECLVSSLEVPALCWANQKELACIVSLLLQRSSLESLLPALCVPSRPSAGCLIQSQDIKHRQQNMACLSLFFQQNSARRHGDFCEHADPQDVQVLSS